MSLPINIKSLEFADAIHFATLSHCEYLRVLSRLGREGEYTLEFLRLKAYKHDQPFLDELIRSIDQEALDIINKDPENPDPKILGRVISAIAAHHITLSNALGYDKPIDWWRLQACSNIPVCLNSFPPISDDIVH